jgi:FtsZ-interacting cell division protein ZipA
MATWAWILIAVGIVIIVALLVAIVMRQRRTTMLRQRFGPEYDRTVQDRDDRRAAEADLRDRQKQRDRLDIRPLAEPARARFAAEWRELQERFVDQPSNAVVAADDLVYRVMSERGYPMDDFETQAKLISVDHPSVVENYRFAHAVCERAQSQQATTEDLRAALLRYRSLFEDLLQSADADRHGEAESRARDASDHEEPSQQSTQRGTR